MIKNSQKSLVTNLLLGIGPFTITIATIASLLLDEKVLYALAQTNSSWTISNPFIDLIQKYSPTILLAVGPQVTLIATFVNKKEHKYLSGWSTICALTIPIIAVFVTIEGPVQRLILAAIMIPATVTLFTIFCNNDKPNTPRSGF